MNTKKNAKRNEAPSSSKPPSTPGGGLPVGSREESWELHKQRLQLPEQLAAELEVARGVGLLELLELAVGVHDEVGARHVGGIWTGGGGCCGPLLLEVPIHIKNIHIPVQSQVADLMGNMERMKMEVGGDKKMSVLMILQHKKVIEHKI